MPLIWVNARKLKRTISDAIDEKRYREKVVALIRDFADHVQPVLDWSRKAVEASKA